MRQNLRSNLKRGNKPLVQGGFLEGFKILPESLQLRQNIEAITRYA